jgi:hypothetical protein
MAMQYDVKQGHLNQSGFFVLGRNRIKGVSWYGSSADGTLVLFDTTTAPTSTNVTYERASALVTVTKNAHGLVTGDTVGIHFNTASNVAATDGNYSITKINANSFSLTDINSGTVANTATAVYVTGANRWLMTYENDSTDTFSNAPVIPGEGVLATNGIYAFMTNIGASQIYYG